MLHVYSCAVKSASLAHDDTYPHVELCCRADLIFMTGSHRLTLPLIFFDTKRKLLIHGNGWHGGEWIGPEGKDPGTYNGTFLYEDI